MNVRFLFVLSVITTIDHALLSSCKAKKIAKQPIRLRPASSKLREQLCDPTVDLNPKICSIVTVYQQHATKQHHKHASLLEVFD